MRVSAVETGLDAVIVGTLCPLPRVSLFWRWGSRVRLWLRKKSTTAKIGDIAVCVKVELARRLGDVKWNNRES